MIHSQDTGILTYRVSRNQTSFGSASSRIQQGFPFSAPGPHSQECLVPHIVLAPSRISQSHQTLKPKRYDSCQACTCDPISGLLELPSTRASHFLKTNQSFLLNCPHRRGIDHYNESQSLVAMLLMGFKTKWSRQPAAMAPSTLLLATR